MPIRRRKIRPRYASRRPTTRATSRSEEHSANRALITATIWRTSSEVLELRFMSYLPVDECLASMRWRALQVLPGSDFRKVSESLASIAVAGCRAGSDDCVRTGRLLPTRFPTLALARSHRIKVVCAHRSTQALIVLSHTQKRWVLGKAAVALGFFLRAG